MAIPTITFFAEGHFLEASFRLSWFLLSFLFCVSVTLRLTCRDQCAQHRVGTQTLC